MQDFAPVFLLAKAPDIELMKAESKRDNVVPAADERKYLLKTATCNELLADVVTIPLDTAMRPEVLPDSLETFLGRADYMACSKSFAERLTTPTASCQ